MTQPAKPEPIALTLFVDGAVAVALVEHIVAQALPVSVSSVSSVVHMQSHAIRALEMQLRDQGRELEETRRQLNEAENRLKFP